jgi:hypothetical protein
MAEIDEEFIKKMEDDFGKASSKFEKAFILATGKDKTGTAVDSPFLEMIAKTGKQQTDLATQIADLKNLQVQNQPIGETKKKAIDDVLKTFDGDATKLREGLDFAMDARPPSTFAWSVFVAGVGVLIAMFFFYYYLHANGLYSPPTQSMSDTERLSAVDALASIRTQATFLGELLSRGSALQKDEEKVAKATLNSLREHVQKTLQEPVDTLKVVVGLSPDTGGLYSELKNETTPKSASADGLGSQNLNSKAIIIYSNQISKTIRDLKEPYFWERGSGRYAEVLFGSFFGAMVFALYNWWKHMRRPARAWWLGWGIAKIFLALMVSFTLVAILSQVNFTTPSGLQSQTAFGLGTAPIEIVIAVSILAGYFGHKALDSLENYADRLFGSTSSG